MAIFKNSYCSQSDHSQGFILPIAMGMGLIVLLIGTAMLLRSQTDQVTAISQRATTRSLAAAETGITRFQTLLGKYNAIAQYPACINWSGSNCADSGAEPSWANPNSLPTLGTSVCGLPAGLGPDLQQAVTQNWQTIDNDPGRGQYRLINYTYDANQKKGLLVIEGRVNQDVASNVSATQLAVGIPMNVPSANSRVPALWLRDSSDTDMGTKRFEKFKGNIIINDCTLPTGTGQPTIDNLSDPNQFQLAAIPDAFPALPSIPVGAISITATDQLWTELPHSRDTPVDPGTPTDLTDDRYVYKVKDLIPTDSTKRIWIKPNAKVDLYIQGNIELSNDVSINANGLSSQLRIFGNDASHIYGCDLSPPICGTERVQLNGMGTVKALIFAPDATGSITYGAPPKDIEGVIISDEGNFKGSLWLKNWKSSWDGNTERPILADSMGSYADYGFDDFPVYPQRTTLSGIGSWNQQLVSGP